MTLCLSRLQFKELTSLCKMATADGRHTTAIAREEGLDDYEFEDPGQAWVGLCEAARLVDVPKRTEAIKMFLNLAKNSHWDQLLYDTELDLAAVDSEYGGPFPDNQLGGHGGTYGETSDTEDYLEQDGKDQEMEGIPVDADTQHRTKVTARTNWYLCPKCGGAMQDGQPHHCRW